LQEKGWRKSVEPIVLKVKKNYVESNTNGISSKNKKKNGNWVGHILRRDCPVKHGTDGEIEGRIEVLGRRGRRCTQLPDGFKETRKYWKLKEESEDRTV